MEAYITKNQAIHAMEQVTQPECFIEDTRKDFARIVEELPAADVVEVVRCKDCENAIMYCDEFGNHSLACEFWTCEEDVYPVFVDGDDFCNNGK